MTTSQVMHVIVRLNNALDTGKYGEVTVGEIEKHLKKGDLISYLKVRLGKDFNASLFDVKEGLDAKFVRKLKEIHSVYDGRVGRKLGIHNNGLCLLIAHCVEIICEHELASVHYNPRALKNIF